MMSLAFDQKEDLRLRMADLEQKLEESEEERKKLEKTCNMLVRAFREEEKMHYKALNNKYEKFLEDCKVRRRRNDVILNSLCRVEDRARALFARTERLKLLKDRYISYLKPLELKKNEASISLQNFTSKSQVEGVGKTSSKSVSWKSPHVTDFTWDYSPRESQGISEPGNLRRSTTTNEFFIKTEPSYLQSNSYEYLKQKYSHLDNNKDELGPSLYPKEENFRGNVLDKVLLKETMKIREKLELPSSSNKNPAVDIPSYSIPRQINLEKSLRNEDYITNQNKDQVLKDLLFKENEKPKNFSEISNSYVGSEGTNLQKLIDLKEKGLLKHQECIENLKTALSKEEEAKKERDEQKFNMEKPSYETEDTSSKIIEKDEIEMNEKSERNILNKLTVNTHLKTVKENIKGQNSMLSDMGLGIEKDNSKTDVDFQEGKDMEDSVSSEGSLKKDFSFPKGLDGVDYQDETYPESYYEQPVHNHNYSNIVSNVILEEDESEQEVDPPEISTEGANKLSINPTTESDDKTYLPQRVFNGDNSRQSSSKNSPSEGFAGQHTDVWDEPRANGHLEATTPGLNSTIGRDPIGTAQEISHEKVKRRDSTSDNSRGSEKQSEALESDQGNINLNQKAKNITQSNLVHLLESDSESFQIEHGDVVSGNEDSDFDFSFH